MGDWTYSILISAILLVALVAFLYYTGAPVFM